MVFVFEARRLRFSAVTEDSYGAVRPAVLAGSGAVVSEHVDSLPLWDRCLLMAVLPLIAEEQQQQRERRNAAAAGGGLTTDDGAGSSSNDDDDVDTDGGDRDPDLQHRHRPAADAPVTVDDVVLGLKMVRALDELEVAWDSIRAARSGAHNEHGDNGDGGSDRRNRRVPLTDEEVMMEALLAERCGPGFLANESSSSSSEVGGDESIDIAMCFDDRGESVGMGSAGVFGGHGYHHP